MPFRFKLPCPLEGVEKAATFNRRPPGTFGSAIQIGFPVRLGRTNDAKPFMQSGLDDVQLEPDVTV